METYIERVLSFALLVYGLSHMIQWKMWAEFLTEATKHRFGALFIAMPTLAIGLFIVAGHNVWVLGIPLITTLLGWGYVIKSSIYLLWPGTIRRVMPGPEKAHRTLMVVGLVMTVVGAVMVWHAWFVRTPL